MKAARIRLILIKTKHCHGVRDEKETKTKRRVVKVQKTHTDESFLLCDVTLVSLCDWLSAVLQQ